MIQCFLPALATAFLVAPAFTLHAQTYLLPDGTPVAPLITLAANHTLGGLDVDSSGNVFYLDVDNGSSDTRLLERTSAGTTLDLYDATDAGASTKPLFGAFVRLNGNEIYFGFGPNSTTTIDKGTFGTGGVLQVTAGFATIVGAYDLAFSPVSGAAYLSASLTSENNKIYQFDTATGALQLKIDAGQDFSGPIAFNAAGTLFYGASGGAEVQGLYSFRASDLAASGTLTLSSGQQLLATGGNQYLAAGPNGFLLQDYFDNNVLAYDTGTMPPAATALGSTPDTPGFLAAADGRIYVGVTDYEFSGGNFTATSALFSTVPEPASGALLALGVAFAWARRRQR